MAIDALELDRLAVEEHGVALDFHLAEAHLAGADVLAARHHERVEVGLLGAPEVRVRDEERIREVRHLREGGVVERSLHGRRRAVGLDLQAQRRVLVVGGNIRLDDEIADAGLGRGEERHVAEDAGEAEHVLVFEIRTVAPAIDLDGQQVFAILEVGREVEFGRQLGILRVADLLTVEPEVVGGIDAIEANVDVASLPVGRHRERGAIGRNGVPFRIRMRRVRRMRILDVRVDRHAVAAHLHATRHIDERPVGIVKVGLPEIHRTLLHDTAPVVTPVAVERNRVG